MSQKIEQADGTEVEVFTAAEVTAQIAAEVAKKETEFGTVRTDLEGKLTEAQKAAADRAQQFGEFRKLNEQQLEKLTVAERTIYENTLLLQAEREKNAGADKTAYDAAVDATIRAKIGNDPKLFDKAKAMYGLINLEDVTPAQMQQRVAAAVGALVQTEPDLLASLGVSSSGTYMPPVQKAAGEESFADTERGRAGAAELGIIIEAPKK